MNKTSIPWADYSWNPITGCTKISAGCQHCYAHAIADRFNSGDFSVKFHPERLTQPEKIKKPKRVFVCSISDIGHYDVKPEWREQISASMLRSPQHTYIILTKRPEPWLREMPQQCWVGVSIEMQNYMIRWNQLLAWSWLGSPVKFVSVEPMLGPVSFRNFPRCVMPDWVIAGPETGRGARLCKDEWIEALQQECNDSQTPFFDKRDNFKFREFPL